MPENEDTQGTKEVNPDASGATDEKEVVADKSAADKAREKFQETIGEKPPEETVAEDELKIKLDESDGGEVGEEKPKEKQEKVEIVDLATKLKDAGFDNPEDLLEAHQKLGEDHSKLKDDSSSKFEFLNSIEAQNPEVANEIYGLLIKAQMKQRGIDIGEEKSAPEPPKQSRMVKQLMNTVNPATEKNYTEAEATQVKDNTIETLKEFGFVQEGSIKDGIEAYDAQRETKKAIKSAGQSTRDFRKAWEPKTKAMGLNWDTDVANGMANYFQELGVKDTDFNKFTPANLAKAFNGFIMSKEGGMEMLLKNAVVAKTETKKGKKGTGKVLPKTDMSRATTVSDDILDDIKKLSPKEKTKALRELTTKLLREKSRVSA